MKAMQTRVYTNVILTVIAVLLAAFALQPVMDFASDAYAQRDREITFPSDDLEPPRGDYESDFGQQAEAQREIADAIREMSEAARDSADAQREIADAIRSLGNL